MKLILLLTAAAVCCGQDMSPTRLLIGDWHTKKFEVAFTMDPHSGMMVGRTRMDGINSNWRRMMLIFPEGKQVRAEFFDSKDHVTHYRLRQSEANALEFRDDPLPGEPLHTLTYARQTGGDIRYRFQTGDATIDEGILTRDFGVRPLSE